MGSNGGGGDDDDEDGDSAAIDATAPLMDPSTSTEASKKKRRKRPKKKSKASKQSSPPRIPLDDLYPSGDFPTGEFQDHGAPSDTVIRVKSPELRAIEQRSLEDPALLKDYRKAAEIHRQVRQWVQKTVKPGHTLTEIAVGIEDGVRALLNNQGLEPGESLRSGMGFPTGLSINNCVAHYTPNPGQKDVVLKHEDVMKVDFGVQINGWIVDSAFTMSFDPTYDNLLAAVKDATNTGIKVGRHSLFFVSVGSNTNYLFQNAGVDVRISDVSAAIQEAMESYEVEISGKTYPVKAVRNLCGHDILQYHIHGAKQIPFIKNNNQTKMEEGDIFAIETFGTTGRGYIRDGVSPFCHLRSFPKLVCTNELL